MPYLWQQKEHLDVCITKSNFLYGASAERGRCNVKKVPPVVQRVIIRDLGRAKRTKRKSP